jgi:hypothetical protein
MDTFITFRNGQMKKKGIFVFTHGVGFSKDTALSEDEIASLHLNDASSAEHFSRLTGRPRPAWRWVDGL